MQRFKVVAALVLATVDNKVHYVYRDNLLPLGADPDRVEQWVAQGLVEVVEGPAVDPATALAEALANAGLSVEQAAAILAAPAQAPVEGDENGDGVVNATDTAALPADAPKRSASKVVWADYSVKAGMDPAAVEAATRDDLIAAAAARAVAAG